MKKVAFLALLGIGLTSCGHVVQSALYEGASVGATGGAVIGALTHKDNRWYGMSQGKAIGGMIGETVAKVATRAAQEAASRKKPVEYVLEDGTQRIYIEPVASKGKCSVVRVTYYQGDKVVKVEEKEVCQ